MYYKEKKKNLSWLFWLIVFFNLQQTRLERFKKQARITLTLFKRFIISCLALEYHNIAILF